MDRLTAWLAFVHGIHPSPPPTPTPQECLTPETTIELLEACKKGNPPKMGKWGSLPMNGQVSCEGPHGKTTLFDEPPAPGFMMRKDLEAKVDPASVKKEMHY